MTSILLTGFEPFGGETTNPSWTTVTAVRDAWGGAEQVHIRELPVAFDAVGDALAAAIAETRPDIVVCVGQAGGAATVQVERVAINVDDARIPDNTGFQPIDEPIVPGAPAAYFSTLPIKAAVAAVTALGIPAVVSQTAGTYTCNHVFYLLMHSLGAAAGPAEPAGAGTVRGGFVHVPYGPDQVVGTDRPSMPIADMTAAVTAIVDAALSQEVDTVAIGGELY
jgi:pyroglutamyl-peptidase